MNATLRIEEDKIVKTTVEEFDRYVDWDDIKGYIEGDDWTGEAPWEHCDGWEHTFDKDGYWDHDDKRDHYSYVNRSSREGGSGYIDVDDDDVVKWGCVGPTGCSKQVRFEAIARAKRKATEQIVKWYEDGWHVNCAIAKCGDYISSIGGIYDTSWGEHSHECAEECRREVAAEMERDGYIVEDQPAPPKPYSRVDAFRDCIRRNMNTYHLEG